MSLFVFHVRKRYTDLVNYPYKFIPSSASADIFPFHSIAIILTFNFLLADEMPYLKCPLHTVLKLTPVAYGRIFSLFISDISNLNYTDKYNAN